MCVFIDRDKDSLTDDKSSDLRHRLIDFLSDKGFDLIGHSNSHQETVANIALDEGECLSLPCVDSFYKIVCLLL